MILKAKLTIAAIGNADVAVAVIAGVGALQALRVAVPATLGLEVGEALAAMLTVQSLNVAVTALALQARHAISAATTLHLGLTLATTTALHLRLALAAATSALDLRLTLAAPTTLCLGLTAAAALDLRVTAAVAALLGLCRSRCGYRYCRDTCCKDELPHRKFSFVPRGNGPVTEPFHLLRDEKGLAARHLA